jgi:type I restriction enzyme S subunit
LQQTLVPVPTLAEQTAIATALSDADALISGLEKLIAKKRHIKQGAMQQLLQPKEGWEVKLFKDLCWFQEGPGLRNWQFTKRGIKVINVTNLENGLLNLDRTDRHISLEEFHKMYEHFEIDENDIVVASSGNSYGKVAVVRKQDLPLVMNTSVIRFKPLKELDYDFLLTYLKSNQFKHQIDLLITGGAQPNFGPVHLNKISINLPPTKEEQTRIATILSDMDLEIGSLEAKLEKYKKVKLGMMQELLTGKTRLV